MPTHDIKLPTLHSGQIAAFKARTRFQVLRCGRRWGKSAYMLTIIADAMIKGQRVGIFTPDYRLNINMLGELHSILEPIILSSNRNDGRMTTTTGGELDAWSTENDRAGRSRKYHLVCLDETAFCKPNMEHIWKTCIRPTLVDFQGSAIVASTPAGRSDENFFYRICTDPSFGFSEYIAPIYDNPLLPKEELELIKENNEERVFKQEYLAEFVNWSGDTFFNMESILVNGQPVPIPTKCDYVFCVIDTAVKTGSQHDSTAVFYFAFTRHEKHPLVILDWDVLSMEGSLLEVWIPNVLRQLEEFAKITGARMGSGGVHVEDKVSGTILIQQAKRRKWPVHAISGKLTQKGKDERAVSVSGYVYQGKVKISEPAYNKKTKYKGSYANHALTQIFDYRLGVRDQRDDALDCFCYGISISLGDSQGF